ncbi:30S ribosomal protein S7 [Sedimentisphaera salicampi]|uniref:Small ribosomal subunit protein uS7 n=1 Tax=Sedimentisphaera salicampi TaxID=1941349 RepID=A0A1W6LLH0_9BACT|nr:30S ribosomal protein S7 [Sedimentisphaera salicampi]ARN56592.1 30S ribosomal protein S7 [Sedimentisphaera salicampi]OXU15479.1 30S ribosomal protein S7 [Sedimentisphaera salicampi]
MAKKFTASATQLQADPVYGSKLIAKFINCLMLDGKKSVARKVFYDAMGIVEKRIKDCPPNEVFEKAIENVKPALEVRSKRVGGASYQVPMQVKPNRQRALAFRWILDGIRGKKGRPLAERLAAELCDAYKGEGSAMTMRTNVHRMAEANKAFAHFAW